jgi:hypothetical protein
MFMHGDDAQSTVITVQGQSLTDTNRRTIMRKLLLATSAVFLLSGGVALAGEGGPGPGPGPGGGTPTTTTTTNDPTTDTAIVVPIKNATSVGTGNSSATSGGTAVSASLSGVGNTTSSNNESNSDNTALSFTKNLNDVGNTALEFVRSDTKVDVTLASSKNDGNVSGTLSINDPNCGCDDREDSNKVGALTGDASMTNVANGQGIVTAQQNTGVDSQQQNSVALGSVVQGGSGFGSNGL